jgi:hypothetical protein
MRSSPGKPRPIPPAASEAQFNEDPPKVESVAASLDFCVVDAGDEPVAVPILLLNGCRLNVIISPILCGCRSGAVNDWEAMFETVAKLWEFPKRRWQMRLGFIARM